MQKALVTMPDVGVDADFERVHSVERSAPLWD